MDSISALTHSRPLPVEKHLTDCGDPFSTTDVHLAYSCLDRLIKQPTAPDEDGAVMYEGARAIIRLMGEGLARRREVAMAALRAMSAAVARDRAQREKK